MSEADVDGSRRAAFEDIKAALGLPHVSTVHQAFAAYPDFFRLHWQTFRPVVATDQFFSLADRLRADAYTRAFNYFVVPNLAARLNDSTRDQVAQATELLQYKNPLLLLITAAQFQAFESPVGHAVCEKRAAERQAYANAPQLVEEAQASPPVRRVYEEIRRTFNLPFVSYDYHVLARWPEFLMAYWDALKTSIASPLYEGIHHGIRETAWVLSRELPGPFELTVAQLGDAGMSDDDISSVVRLTEVFVSSLSALVLNTAVARIALEGGTRLQTEPAMARPGEEKAA